MKKISITNSHLNYFIEEIPKSLSLFHETFVPNSVQWFTLGMLQRLLNSSTSIKILLKKYTKDGIIDFGVGIIIRSVLLDILIGLNLYKELKNGLVNIEDNNELVNSLDKFCIEVLSDGFSNTLDHFELLRKYEIITEKKLEELYNQFCENYSDFIIQDGKANSKPKVRNKKKVNAKELFMKSILDGHIKDIAKNVYELYMIFSKYDHFGFLSIEINNLDIESKLPRVEQSISLFVNHYANLVDLLHRVTPKTNILDDLLISSQNYLAKKTAYNKKLG
jgi:hypothetical protein